MELKEHIGEVLREQWGLADIDIPIVAERIAHLAEAAYGVPEDCIRLRGTIKGTKQEPGKPIQITVCVRNDETNRVALARMDAEVNVDGRLQAMKDTLDYPDDEDPNQMTIEDVPDTDLDGPDNDANNEPETED